MQDAKLFRRARRAAGLTYREVAQAARMDTSSIANYEALRGRPSQKAAERWRHALVALLSRRAAEVNALLTEL
jgi:transcriptional regulator with XRE-family HTH domain